MDQLETKVLTKKFSALKTVSTGMQVFLATLLGHTSYGVLSSLFALIVSIIVSIIHFHVYFQ